MPDRRGASNRVPLLKVRNARVSIRSRSHRRAWSRLLLVALLPASLLAAFAAIPLPARAGPCDQVAGVITGDWTVTNTQVCTGIFYTVDGSVNINVGGSLTLINGGLRFAMDATHKGYALNVNGGGELILDHSTVTTDPDAIAPYLKLPLTVSGHLALKNGAALKFPGWFNATSGIIDVTDSTITGFSPSEVLNLGVYADDNDDGPVIDWSATTASLYGSRVERIYENTSAASDPNATGIISGNLALRAASNLYAYDSYLGVDFSNVRGLHNELRVDGTSNAYLYGGTIDRTQDPVVRTDWQPAYVPLAAGGSIFLLRWLRVTAVDSTAFPVTDATITSTLSPGATPAQYPDNGFGAAPSARTLAYMGRTLSGVGAWDHTDSSGVATIPLWTDQVTTASLPNAESFGNYQVVATFTSYTASSGADFAPYPAIAAADNTKWLTVPFPTLKVRTAADLLLLQSDYTATVPVTQGQPFSVSVRIYNQGQSRADPVSIAAFLNGNRASKIGQTDGLAVDVAQSVNSSIAVAGVATLGTQSVMLMVDPANVIVEGGVAQEANNFANITLNVQPPPNGYAAILAPAADQTIEPGTAVSVTGYLRDASANGIVGIPITIELRSGSSVIASNVTKSEAGGSQGDGFFMGILNVPGATAEGSYTIVVTPSSSSISSVSQPIAVKTTVPFLFTPILGLSLWIWLIVILGAAAAIGGGTAYVKFVGLGKLVECGECGSFIRGDAVKCPKCGVEFEKGMAKCSNCQAWIPVNVKQCPECGVEFATGEVEMADYEAQMRRQYDDVKRKFREEASRSLGQSLTDRQFEDWWRTQPTFVTFDEWLREEEEMRRMGSRACPACSTLNSVTARVCHKCGTLLQEETKRAKPATGGRPGRTVPQTPPPPADGGAVPVPTTPVPAKVVQKTPIGGPVVKKNLTGTPPEGQAQGTDAGAGSASNPDEEI